MRRKIMKQDNIFKTMLMCSVVVHVFGLGGMRMFSFPAKADAVVALQMNIIVHQDHVVLPKPDRIDVKSNDKISSSAQVQKVIPQDKGDSFVQEKMSTMPVSKQEQVILTYQQSIKQQVQSHMRYPQWAKKHNIQGVSRVYFKIYPNGNIYDLVLVRTSGSRILDNETLATIKRALPFPSFPEEIHTTVLGMELSVVFNLETS